MINLVDNQCVNNIIHRIEQSRISYNIQTEEFQNLNKDFQVYLNDIKSIDDDNQELQENIEQQRLNSIAILENQLKSFLNDYHGEHNLLNNSQVEYYRWKFRSKTYLNERDELKRRIEFVSSNEKQQKKYLCELQKYERLTKTECNHLNEKFERLTKEIEKEKEVHRRAMNEFDDLQIKLEEIRILRSSQTFEIQKLKEEIELIRKMKNLLDDECQIIVSTQTEANEHFLSYLNKSIDYIRNDFDKLNKTQINQIENHYKQLLDNLEENLTANKLSIDDEKKQSMNFDDLQKEHEILSQELITIHSNNQTLSKRVLSMENQFQFVCQDHKRKFICKDNEFELEKIELQNIYEKLNRLIEYERNLKFELTLYRGVLENRTTSLINDTDSYGFDNKQEKIFKKKIRTQSEYDSLQENIDDITSKKDEAVEIF